MIFIVIFYLLGLDKSSTSYCFLIEVHVYKEKHHKKMSLLVTFDCTWVITLFWNSLSHRLQRSTVSQFLSCVFRSFFFEILHETIPFINICIFIHVQIPPSILGPLFLSQGDITHSPSFNHQPSANDSLLPSPVNSGPLPPNVPWIPPFEWFLTLQAWSFQSRLPQFLSL